MFVGRKKELQDLNTELSNKNKKTAVLIYGKRRVGKSTLIREAAKDYDGIVINHQCVASTFEGNLELIYKSVSDSLSLPLMHFESLFALMDYFKTLDKQILLIIDEYPYLKQTKKKNEVDSYMQSLIDNLPQNVKLILCGSYITIMKELLSEDNPLFGRFSLIQHIHSFDYYNSSAFYTNLSPRDKIAFYAIFGGSPYVLENLDPSISLQDNIVKLLLPETGLIRSHIENIILKEIQKTYDIRIFEILGNGKKRYTEIREKLGKDETGLLDKQLKILLDMEAIHKTAPINRKNDKKKQFYEIVDNLLRFYFTYIFGKTGTISRIGEMQFYNRNIKETIDHFISRRLEGIALQYFHRLSLSGKIEDIEDYGSYWYDDPKTKTNGEFDCVIRRNGEVYDFYECKYYNHPMPSKECHIEKEQLLNIKGIDVSNIGFICTGGFQAVNDNDYILVDGDMLFE
ncbi:AAA family ATPase [Eubacterium xylanophilum]|uniref:AAA family ATPase n=1 Tax=Eubacterium xylanophilum TaxID=39497 RepID=UPI00047BDF41|nr:ATP-binding protein [Eubacterium xylanophilum]